MTIFDVINRIDAIKPNSYTQLEKIRALSTLDGIIKNSIIDTHEGSEDVVFGGYTQETNLTTELLVPAPYDDIYLRWLEMQIDYANGEYGKFWNNQDWYSTAQISLSLNFYKICAPCRRGKSKPTGKYIWTY